MLVRVSELQSIVVVTCMAPRLSDRPVDLKMQLPPLGRPGAEEAPEEATEEPLEYFKDEWEATGGPLVDEWWAISS